MKVCSKCKIKKPFELFIKDKRKTGGIGSSCVYCEKQRLQKYRENNKEKLREKAKIYRELNPEKSAKSIESWKSKNPEKAREYSLRSYYRYHEQKKAKAREYKANNQDKLKQNMKIWRAANKEYIRKYYEDNKAWFKTWNSKRRAQLIKATVSWADLNKIRDIYDRAMFLTEITGIQHHVDHIIPLNSKYVCGLHVEYNLQILTEQENLTKSNKFTPG